MTSDFYKADDGTINHFELNRLLGIIDNNIKDLKNKIKLIIDTGESRDKVIEDITNKQWNQIRTNSQRDTMSEQLRRLEREREIVLADKYKRTSTIIETDEIRQADCLELLIRIKPETKSHGGRASICCPFHEEKTPSCTVYGGRGKGFYCFGCGKGGDAITLVQQLKSFNFRQACEYIQTNASI